MSRQNPVRSSFRRQTGSMRGKERLEKREILNLTCCWDRRRERTLESVFREGQSLWGRLWAEAEGSTIRRATFDSTLPLGCALLHNIRPAKRS